MNPVFLSGIVTAAASMAVGITLAVVKGDTAPLAIALFGLAIGGTLVFFGRKSLSASGALDRDRFAVAFTRTPVPELPATTAAPSLGDEALGDGATTLAVRFVPDSSVTSMPGFGEVYRKIAAGEIQGHVMVIGGPDRGRGVSITTDVPVTVGRGKNHTLNLTDAGVSMDQCEFRSEGGKIMLRDLGSKNGTYVNNQRVDKKVLENCDIVTCGVTKILMTLPG